MCKDKVEVKNTKDEVYYLRDYLGRSLSNCDRVEIDEHVIKLEKLKNFNLIY